MIKLICDSCGHEFESTIVDGTWPLKSKRISIIIASERNSTEPFQRYEKILKAELCDDCLKKLQYIYTDAVLKAEKYIKEELNLKGEYNDTIQSN